MSHSFFIPLLIHTHRSTHMAGLGTGCGAALGSLTSTAHQTTALSRPSDLPKFHGKDVWSRGRGLGQRDLGYGLVPRVWK